MNNQDEAEATEHPSSNLPLLDNPCMTLDTIEEAKESSSLSGESGEYIKETLEVESDTEIQEEKKIKVQWMSDDDDEEEEEVDQDGPPDYADGQTTHPNVDGGWAWVIFLVNFLSFSIGSGLLASSGLYYVQMLNEFKRSRSSTAWMGSLMNAFFMLAGPFSSVIIKKWGCRVTMICGGLIMTAGFLMSSVAQSLPFIFFSYGIVVVFLHKSEYLAFLEAEEKRELQRLKKMRLGILKMLNSASGMNFVYSAQIISMAVYFHKYHSVATSLTMVGIGVGMFILMRALDEIILEYGWRISFIFCAGVSLQLCVFGSLIFPLRGGESSPPPEKGVEEGLSPQDSLPQSPAFGKLVFNRRTLLNRSVSSLRLSVGAGYLSSSFSNLDGDALHGTSTVASNQHSFCSRGSQYLGGIRSNQDSFSQFQNGEIPFGLLPFLRSNQHSFCSKGSSNGFLSLKSNPHSFSIKNSQIDLHLIAHHPYLPVLKDVDGQLILRDKESLNMGSSKFSEIEQINEGEVGGSKCNRLVEKVKHALNAILSDMRPQLFFNPCFWLMNISMFFTMLATMKLLVIYKDLSEWLGFGDYFSHVMSIISLGDILGRLSAGVLSSYEWVNPTLLYGMAVLLCGVFVVFHIVVSSGPVFLVITGLFGFSYGQQNVLITLVPSFLFGKDLLVTVFGYILFFAGMGAMMGAPLAGYIVDETGSYIGVIILSATCCAIGGSCLLLCDLLKKREQKMNQTVSEAYI